jgi:hypothetical protein
MATPFCVLVSKKREASQCEASLLQLKSAMHFLELDSREISSYEIPVD